MRKHDRAVNLPAAAAELSDGARKFVPDSSLETYRLFHIFS